MSLDIVRQVNAQHPQYLQTNLGSTCYQNTLLLVEALRARGHAAFLICKTAGESQYTPPGFTPFIAKGLDGNDYTITGVSPDAIWCDGKQFDTIAQANDSEHPIFHPDGRRMEGVPVWNEIASQHWRPRNPPLKGDGFTPTPPPTPIPAPPAAPRPYPGDAFFTDAIGRVLEDDYTEAGQRLNAGSATWLARTIWRHVNEGMPIEQSVAQSRKEWRAALGLPLLAMLLMLWATPAAAQTAEHHEWWLHGAIFAQGVLATADLSTSSWAKGHDGDRYTEANPLLRWAADDPVALAVAKMSVDGAITWWLVKHHAKRPKVVLTIAVIKGIASAYIAHRNAKTLGLR